MLHYTTSILYFEANSHLRFDISLSAMHATVIQLLFISAIASSTCTCALGLNLQESSNPAVVGYDLRRQEHVYQTLISRDLKPAVDVKNVCCSSSLYSVRFIPLFDVIYDFNLI